MTVIYVVWLLTVTVLMLAGVAMMNWF